MDFLFFWESEYIIFKFYNLSVRNLVRWFYFIVFSFILRRDRRSGVKVGFDLCVIVAFSNVLESCSFWEYI